MRSQASYDFWFFAIVWGLVPVAMMIAGVMVQRFKTQVRLRAIEKGLVLPPESSRFSRRTLNPWEFAANFRLAGIICVAVGLGLLVLFTALAETLETVPPFPKGVIAVSAIPFLLGLGFLLEYRMRSKEIKAREHSESGSDRA